MTEYGLWCREAGPSGEYKTIWLQDIGPQPKVASWSSDPDRAWRFATIEDAQAVRDVYWRMMGGKFTLIIGVLPARTYSGVTY